MTFLTRTIDIEKMINGCGNSILAFKIIVNVVVGKKILFEDLFTLSM
jgi:hypothetical protein